MAIALLLATARQVPAADATLRDGECKRSSFKGVEIFLTSGFVPCKQRSAKVDDGERIVLVHKDVSGRKI